jgi:hypothetical protein
MSLPDLFLSIAFPSIAFLSITDDSLQGRAAGPSEGRSEVVYHSELASQSINVQKTDDNCDEVAGGVWRDY